VNRPIARFAATARYTPERIVTNADFERTLDT
jgi:3-oxoacyl-[acyl-carrier-protein] synthase III